jgi:predicted transcriptional regulator of viral defense system
MTVEKSYSMNQGTRLLQGLINKGKLIFDMAEAKETAKQLNIPVEQLPVLLHHLAKDEWIIRLKRGLYAGSGKLPGGTIINPFVIATRLVDPGAISHWSAMNHHGLTEQLPRNVTVMTTQKVYTPSMRSKNKKSGQKHGREIDGVRVEYVTVKATHYFGIEQIWIDQHFKISITDKERTLLEGFSSPRSFGSLSEILGILEEHLGELDVDKLIAYALQYDNIAVVKRLGWALEHLGIDADRLQQLRDYPATGYRLLDPTKPKRGKYESRWMIQNNLKAKF